MAVGGGVASEAGCEEMRRGVKAMLRGVRVRMWPEGEAAKTPPMVPLSEQEHEGGGANAGIGEKDDEQRNTTMTTPTTMGATTGGQWA
uniref:Uncharacterized protein n=1 Tax=Leersia perrieri TaxID=77586 RepID=A0A0D9X9N5_9ORYZ